MRYALHIAASVLCCSLVVWSLAYAQALGEGGGYGVVEVGGSGSDATAIHDNVAGEINAVGAITVASGDLLIAEDADAGNAKGKVTAGAIAALASFSGDVSGGTTQTYLSNVVIDGTVTGNQGASNVLDMDTDGKFIFTNQAGGVAQLHVGPQTTSGICLDAPDQFHLAVLDGSNCSTYEYLYAEGFTALTATNSAAVGISSNEGGLSLGGGNGVFRGSASFDHLAIGVSSAFGYQVMIVPNSYVSGSMSDLGIPNQSYPVIGVRSVNDPATNATEWWIAGHDGTDPILTPGKGDWKFQDDGGKGVASTLATATESLTFAGDPGDASKTTSGLIPDGAFVFGLTTRVTTTGTNCATIDIGDGSDVDMFADEAAITQNSTTTNAAATAQFAMSPAIGAQDVTVTGTNGAGGAANCFDLVIAVTAHYLNPGAATSN